MLFARRRQAELEPMSAASVAATLQALGAPPGAELSSGEVPGSLVSLVHDHALASAAELPAFARSAAAILDLARRPEPDMGELVAAAAEDPTVSLELVRVSNSAAQANRMPIRSVRDAVVRLGARAASRVAAAVASRALFDGRIRAGQQRFRPAWDGLWAHSSACAFAAGELVASARVGDPSEVFLGGLFHHAGAIAALRALGDLAESGALRVEPTFAQVTRVVEIAHEELGAVVAEKLALPPRLAQCCLQHHQPASGDLEMHALRVVSCASERLRGACPHEDADEEIAASLEALGLTEDALEAVARSLRAANERLR